MNPSPRLLEVTSLWSRRFQTINAILLILRAQWLIRRSPMSSWRGSLGSLYEQSNATQWLTVADDEMRIALALARRIERAAKRFPLEPKCLPKAMALQWLLAPIDLPSRLVIAMQKRVDAHDDSGEHAFHAWVELSGQMLIGACDSAQYRTVLMFEHAPAGPR